MKVYELSKKHSVTNREMIKILDKLEISTDKKINSFTPLELRDIRLIDNYFKKGSPSKKEKKIKDLGEVLIIKKASKSIVKEDKGAEKSTEKEDAKEKEESKKKEAQKAKPAAVKKVKRKVVRIIKKETTPTSKKLIEKEKHIQENAEKTKTKKDDRSIEISTEEKQKEIKIHETKIKQDAKETKKPIQLKNIAKQESKQKIVREKPKTEIKGKNTKPGTWKRYSRRPRDRFREKEIIQKKKAAHKVALSSIPSSIKIMDTITVSDLAKKMNIKVNEIIAKLISLGVMVTINQVIDSDTATIVANEYNCQTNIISLYDETVIEKLEDKEEELQTRAPIVTVMGHVDHGKTKLLDVLRKSDIVSSEDGGITQHIGAYQVNIQDKKVVFLDTPGHEAFTAMRARGAKVTDVVVLVVAADDGVMSQTIEAVNHAKEAKVSIIVAINKIDSPNSNPDRVRQQLADIELIPEEWGGQTAVVEISALKKEGIDKLLESILLETEILELKANPNRMATGIIIESQIDKGRGSVATVLVQNGTLKVGDSFVSGIYYGKTRALFNDRARKIEKATPSTPVEVIGLDGVPGAGDPFNVVAEEKLAKQIAQKRQELEKISKAKDVKKLTLNDISKQIQEGIIQELKVVLKSDVQGSVEALQEAFQRLSNNEIEVKVIHAATGAINENDIMLASASSAIIVGFHVHPNTKALLLARRENVEILKHSIIYEAIDSIKSAMEGLIAPDLKEDITGQAEVREIFRIPKIGTIAGCHVTSGKVVKNGKARIIRDGIELYTGDVLAIKRFKNDVSEAKEGFECGISIKNYQDLKLDDVIETFVIKEVARTL